MKKKLRTYVFLLSKLNNQLKRAGQKNLLQLLTTSVMKNSLEDNKKKLKFFAHKGEVKPSSTIMEPSIPFHTLVKLIDAEVITIEKIVLLIYHWK